MLQSGFTAIYCNYYYSHSTAVCLELVASMMNASWSGSRTFQIPRNSGTVFMTKTKSTLLTKGLQYILIDFQIKLYE